MPMKPKARAHGKKVGVSITLPPDLYKWVSERVEARDYASISHAIERGLMVLREKGK